MKDEAGRDLLPESPSREDRLKMGKAMVIDQVPKRIKHLKFGCMDPSDLVRQGVLEVSTRDLYTFGGSERAPASHGALDRRMVLHTFNLSRHEAHDRRGLPQRK